MSENKIKLHNVRLSFPSIFQRSSYDGEEGKYEASFLIPKSDTKTVKLLQDAIEAAIKESKVDKVPSDKRCLKDGDDFEYDGYADHMSIKGSSKRRPTVLNHDKSPVVEDDGIIYAGCYVNAVIGLWVQDNKYGKRVNCNLYGIQFYRDGEPFGSGDVDVSGDFEEVDPDTVPW